MDRAMASRGAFISSYEEVRPVAVHDGRDAVFCPKPRRLTQLIGVDSVRPRRIHLWQQADPCDSTAAGAELLDIILAKGTTYCSGSDPLSCSWTQVPSSPPYFCGSPPSRADNPLVHDPRFLEERSQQQQQQLPTPTSPSPVHYYQQQQPMSPTAGSRKGGSCVRPATKFGPLPATVRIEGFDCLDRGRSGNGGCRISAVA